MLLEVSPNVSTASSAWPSASSGASASSTRQRWRSSFAIWKSIPAGYASASAPGGRPRYGGWGIVVPIAPAPGASAGGSRRSSMRVSRGNRPAASASSASNEPAISTSTLPSACASGPASAYPSGSRPIETIQSYALTRDSLSGGIRSARAVSHQTLKSATPAPASRIAGTTAPSVTPAPYSTSAAGQTRIASIAARMGWRGRQPDPSSEPAIVPTPNAADTRP